MVLGERSFHQQPKKKIKKTKTKWYSIDDHSLSSIKAMPMGNQSLLSNMDFVNLQVATCKHRYSVF